MSGFRGTASSVGIILVIVLIVLSAGGSIFANIATATTVTDTVIRIDRVVKANGNKGFSSKWIVTCKNEVFENVDNFIPYFKFNSSDLNRKLTPGQTYTFKVYGWRVPFLSWYRNIVRIEE